MHHHLRIVPPRGIITHALNNGGKSAPARLLITKLELYPHKPRKLLTRTCNLIFLLELFPSNLRTFARPRGIITHALNKGGKSAPALLFITKLELYPRKPRQILMRAYNLLIF